MQMPAILKQLLMLLADGKFHSGSALSVAVGISRSAIWKQLQALTDLGVELIAVSGKGYRLGHGLVLLNQAEIEQNLHPPAQALLHKLEIHDVLHSTNTYLLEQARQGGVSGQVCLAEYQSAGKGRRGRSWVSPFAQNIYISLLWRYQDGPAAIAGLSLAAGVAVVRALRALGIHEIGLKWPNDIYWRYRKLAGILVEVSGESGGPCYAVLGLGLNFYLSPQQAEIIDQPWTDICRIMGDADSYQLRNKLVGLLLNELLPMLANFSSSSFSHYVQEWRTYDCMLARDVKIVIGEQSYLGKVAGINDDGLLLLEMPDGSVRSFASGEVSVKAL
ncbi:bifunctional biotin--[acetyl-CoA-carboxylase] ligase/biotin operon repressor BirA [Methylomonas paludis]|uniref:Bifunctional ligase/repressor BirA n=1 Tax=Methylomonas paludis TaxID=1173101 RepID=A0A975MKM4_9GAMM|nr:bifunctional biotin--[acetyl-CoA-carboxylase] ligase/biotin operon repressor BirA [Methylomonas paludis]QWF69643.1 bifunctional biotin--[acetyl-CoA-carboxylase] ligase/biotin operon repressor BirA [Methylomonas paludis]